MIDPNSPEYVEDTSKAVGPGDDVLTRDLSSGKIHRRIRIGDNLASIEADNLDDAGEYEVITAERLAEAEPGELCERCFPPIPAPKEVPLEDISLMDGPGEPFSHEDDAA